MKSYIKKWKFNIILNILKHKVIIVYNKKYKKGLFINKLINNKINKYNIINNILINKKNININWIDNKIIFLNKYSNNFNLYNNNKEMKLYLYNKKINYNSNLNNIYNIKLNIIKDVLFSNVIFLKLINIKNAYNKSINKKI